MRILMAVLAVLVLPASADAYDHAVQPSEWTLASKHLTAKSRTVRITVQSGGCTDFDHLTVARAPGAVVITTYNAVLVLGPYDIVPPCPAPVPQVKTVKLSAPLGADVVEDGSTTPPAIRFAGAPICPASAGAVVDTAPARSRLVRGAPRSALLCRYAPAGGLQRRARVGRRDARRLALGFDALPDPGPGPTACPLQRRGSVLVIFPLGQRILTQLDGCRDATGGGLTRRALAAPALIRRLVRLTR